MLCNVLSATEHFRHSIAPGSPQPPRPAHCVLAPKPLSRRLRELARPGALAGPGARGGGSGPSARPRSGWSRSRNGETEKQSLFCLSPAPVRPEPLQKQRNRAFSASAQLRSGRSHSRNRETEPLLPQPSSAPAGATPETEKQSLCCLSPAPLRPEPLQKQRNRAFAASAQLRSGRSHSRNRAFAASAQLRSGRSHSRNRAFAASAQLRSGRSHSRNRETEPLLPQPSSALAGAAPESAPEAQEQSHSCHRLRPAPLQRALLNQSHCCHRLSPARSGRGLWVSFPGAAGEGDSSSSRPRFGVGREKASL